VRTACRRPEALRQAALALIRERYWDFGSTYSDKHGVFRVNHQGALGGDGRRSLAAHCTR
jgi:hypothetical protein